MIKIDFEILDDNGLPFKDALHLPDDHTFTDDEIEAMKQERFNNWVAFIEAQSLAEAPVEVVE